jgi:hypothetical protein
MAHSPPLVTQGVFAVDTDEGFKGSCYCCEKPGHCVPSVIPNYLVIEEENKDLW